MIDIDNFMNEIYTPLVAHSNVSQLVKDNQKIPPGQLKNDRVVYNMILFSNTDPRYTIIKNKNVVTSNDPEFDYDIEIENIFFPEATLSFTGFNNIMVPINKIREWFYVNGLGGWWLKDNGWNCVIREVMEMENRTTFLESDYEKRYDTIETVEVTGPTGNIKEINI